MRRNASRLCAIALFAAALGLWAAAPAWGADITSADNIQLDGDTDETTVPTGIGGVDDWDEVYNDCTNFGCTPTATVALRQIFITDPADADPTAFDGGLKDDMHISDWTCTTAGVQSKSDILNAYGATYTDDAQLYLYAGADREGNNGTANFGIWLFQNPVDCLSAGGSTPFTGEKVDGDLLLVAEFETGGRVAVINVYRWWDPDSTPQSGDECLGGTMGDCSDAGTPTFTGLNCADSTAGDQVCGITNDTAVINADWRAGMDTNIFYEAGINLTELVGELGCFANAMIETRSSTSLNASLKDFAFLDLSTCGTLTVNKVANEPGTFGFTFDDSADPGPPGSPFELMTGGSVFFPTVEPSTDYRLEEDSLPSGPADPLGWHLTNIECTGASGASAVMKTGTNGDEGGYIDLNIDLNDDVECTVTNVFTPPPGTITINKVCIGDTGTFSYTGDLSPFDVPCNDSMEFTGLDAGTYDVTETAQAGWDLTDISCTDPTTNSTTTLGTATASIVLDPGGESVSCTFTNTRRAEVTICKDTDPPATGGDFSYSGDLGMFTLADGDCTEPLEVLPTPTTTDVTEAAKAGFTLDNINCTGANWTSNVGTGTVSVTPDPGESVECHFFNTQNPGHIQVCKETDPGGSTQSFELGLDGPDSDLPVSTSIQDGECDFGTGDDNEVTLTAGTGYSVDETQLDGWEPYEVSCVGGAGAENPADIDLAADETVVCTFTNVQQGSITIEKDVTDDAALDFPFSGDLGDFTINGDGSQMFDGLTPDTYVVTEGDTEDYRLAGIDCGEANVMVNGSTATIELGAGEDVTCVFTNEPAPSGIPTLSEWGLGALAALLALLGVAGIRRRSTAER